MPDAAAARYLKLKPPGERKATLIRITKARAKKLKDLPRQKPPESIRLAYFAELRKLVAVARAMVIRSIYPVGRELVRNARGERGDAHDDGKIINSILAGLDRSWDRELGPEISAVGAKIGRRTAAFQKTQLSGQLKKTLGINVPESEPWLERRIQDFTAVNVALIKSIPRDYFAQVEQRLLTGIQAGKRWEDIASELTDRFDVAESRAKLIARDQVGKFFSELNRTRQKKLGISTYRWRGVLDNRERPEHEELEGEVFSWDDPPSEGHPGDAVNCRCVGEPVLEEDAEE